MAKDAAADDNHPPGIAASLWLAAAGAFGFVAIVSPLLSLYLSSRARCMVAQRPGEYSERLIRPARVLGWLALGVNVAAVGALLLLQGGP